MDEYNYRFTIFLVKEIVKGFKECVKEGKGVKYVHLKAESGIDGLIVYTDTILRKPEWMGFLESFTDEEIEIRNNASNKALLLIRVNKRIMAIAFGYGRSLLKEEYIVKNFGFITALNMLDEKKIRSVNAATIEDMIVHTQKQSMYATNQTEFSLNHFHDIMTAITGKTKDEIYASYISGRDSLVVTVRMFSYEILDKLNAYLMAYESNVYKKYFSWIDNIREIRDKDLIRKLDERLMEQMLGKQCNNIYISPPNTLSWEFTKGFMLTGIGKSIRDPNNYFEEINLIEYVDSLSTEIDLNKKLKRDRLVTLNLDNEPITVCSVYSAIVAQVKLEGKVYVCCDGRWYCLDLGFYTEVMDFVKKIPVSDVDLPNCYPNEAEGDYNLRASEEMDYCLLDKKMFGVKQGPRKVEVCDLFTRNKQFIHVKKRESSSQLSHLFSQGKVAVECFLSDEEFRKQLYDEVKTKFGKKVFDYKSRPKSEEYEIVYAIIAKSGKDRVTELPFFSLVNLMLSVQELERMHIRYSVKFISQV